MLVAGFGWCACSWPWSLDGVLVAGFGWCACNWPWSLDGVLVADLIYGVLVGAS